ncbi:MAG: tetratricopeptide repeat protein [Hahellaceae bacterium]|nr:tetratricopeptide repeat protein [Hahellaceae bacterium]
MIVDELDTFRFSTKKALMSLGLKLIDTAASGQQVISALQNVDYDVILCNFDLGKGKNGQELLEELRYKKLLKYSSLFFIISAEVAKDKVMGTIENEPDGYFVKPVNPADLGKRLSKSLEQKEATRAIDQALDQNDLEKALTLCNEKIERKEPYRLLCLKIKSWILTKLGRQQEARSLYEQLLKSAEYNWAEFGLANILIDEGDYDIAEELLKKIIDKDENRVEAYDQLAQIAAKKKDLVTARSYLQEAANRSPNSLHRQKALADISLKSGNDEDAFEAFRKVIKLSEQSIYADTSHFFEFADQLTKSAAQENEGFTGKKYQKEAFDLLQKAKKRFSERPQIDEQTRLMEASLNANLGNTEEAEKILGEVNEKSAKKGLTLSAESSLVAAKVLYGIGKTDEAEKLLEATADGAQGEGKILSQAYDMMESAISLKQRQQAADANRQGIKLYNDGKLDESIKLLNSAIPLTPRHISLNLNLLQVLLKRAKDQGLGNNKQQCELCLHRVRHIPETHKEYKRFAYLKKQFEKAVQG